jgi:hypothetical protein
MTSHSPSNAEIIFPSLVLLSCWRNVLCMALDSLDMLLFLSKDVSALHMSHMRLTSAEDSERRRETQSRTLFTAAYKHAMTL